MEGTYLASLPGYASFYEGIQAWMSYDGYVGSATKSTLSGIGQTWPYVRSKGVYFCPANPRTLNMMQRWDGLDPYDGFGVQGRRALTTYFYRNGMYPVALNPTDLASWGSWSPVRLGDDRLQGRVMMTDFWWPYVPAVGVYQNPEWLPHDRGKSVSLLWTDGSASVWTLPKDVTPVWDWFGAGALTEAAFDCSMWRQQSPWWWTVAERSR